jgi:methylmalonyl-CoA mutase
MQKPTQRIRAETLKPSARHGSGRHPQGGPGPEHLYLFSTEFALQMMGDIQQYFIDHNMRNFYSVSISGYHIAEAGANPISQLAFTLANGFTIVEYYLARGMRDRQFAPNLSSSSPTAWIRSTR